MTVTFKRSARGYEARVDGEVIGEVRKVTDSYSGMGLGTYTSWVAVTKDGESVRRVGTYLDKRFATTDDFAGRTKFSTRIEAGEALAAVTRKVGK